MRNGTVGCRASPATLAAYPTLALAFAAFAETQTALPAAGFLLLLAAWVDHKFPAKTKGNPHGNV